MTTAIAIVGYRNPDDVRQCLGALARSTDGAFTVHICENGGHAAARALVEALAGRVAAAPAEEAGTAGGPLVWHGRLEPGGQAVRVLCSGENLGYAGGVNTAIRDAMAGDRWDAVWVLNPDTEPAPDALAEMHRHLARGPYGMVGSRLVFRKTGRVQLYGGRWRPLIARGFNIGLNQPGDATPDIAAVEAETTYVNGASMLVSRAFIEDVGLMDERYFLYNEEVDWCFRRGNHRLGYAHAAVVAHDHGSTIGSNTQRRQRSALSVYLDERNKLLFSRRFFPRLYPVILLTTLVLTAQYLRHGAVRNFFVALQGWFAGLRGEEGVPALAHRPRPRPAEPAAAASR